MNIFSTYTLKKGWLPEPGILYIYLFIIYIIIIIILL